MIYSLFQYGCEKELEGCCNSGYHMVHYSVRIQDFQLVNRFLVVQEPEFRKDFLNIYRNKDSAIPSVFHSISNIRLIQPLDIIKITKIIHLFQIKVADNFGLVLFHRHDNLSKVVHSTTIPKSNTF